MCRAAGSMFLLSSCWWPPASPALRYWCCATPPPWACCSPCISASCSGCFSACLTASSCTGFTASSRSSNTRASASAARSWSRVLAGFHLLPVQGVERNNNLASQAAGFPVEPQAAFQFGFDDLADHARAEALAARPLDGRAAGFSPADRKLGLAMRPFDAQPPRRHRKRAVFDGVRRQLVQDHRDGLCRLRFQNNLWTVDLGALGSRRAIGRKLFRNEAVQARSRPTRLRDQRVRVRKRLETALDGRLEMVIS